MSLFSSWDGQISTEATNGFLTELAWLHLERVSNPACQKQKDRILTAISVGDYGTLCNLELDYAGLQPLDALNLGQCLAFFKKRSDIDLGIERREVARRKFQESEHSCRTMNHIFRAWGSGGFQFPPDVESALHAARWKISQVLGDVPSLAELRLRFGPGASTQVPKRSACAKMKLSQKACCSEDLIPLVNEMLEEIPGYVFPYDPKYLIDHLTLKTPEEIEREIPGYNLELDFNEYYVDQELTPVEVEIHPGKLEFVPKSAKTDRAIMVEPWLNQLGQLAVGDYMARRLKRFGVDLSDQTRNKRLAREGSITGALATLDLSSASDSISTGLVEHLLPTDWFDLLSCLRTGLVKEADGPEMRLFKFSSMGNGFTFPLESLIFWALTRACCDDREVVSVYGDDIICPTERVRRVLSVLTSCGFTVNKEKSFWEGPFRESCGGDYLSGIDVRPCFITGPLSGHDAFRLHNYYMRSGEVDLAYHVRKHIDDNIALLGPDGFGDGVLVGYQWTPRIKADHLDKGYGGVVFDTWCYKKRNFKRRLPGDRVLPGYTIYTRERVDGSSLLTLFEEEKRFRNWLINQDPDMAPSFFEMSGQRFTTSGVPENFVPGTKGCKRISIYTLDLP
jgi:hypothetical protein